MKTLAWAISVFILCKGANKWNHSKCVLRLQLMALEQLCMLLLMSDNIDRCFESCPPRTFLPALCKIFLDETAPENVLEVCRAKVIQLSLAKKVALLERVSLEI